MPALDLAVFARVHPGDVLVVHDHHVIEVLVRAARREVGRAGEHRFAVADDELLVEDAGVVVALDIDVRAQHRRQDRPVGLVAAQRLPWIGAHPARSQVVVLDHQLHQHPAPARPHDRLRDRQALELLHRDLEPLLRAVDEIHDQPFEIVGPPHVMGPRMELHVAHDH